MATPLTPQLQAIDQVIRLINREVWIVTAQAHDQRGGLLASWVTQASLDPARPVMVAGIAPNHFTADLIDRSGCFALHLLGKKQTDLALNFAIGSGRDRDKLAGLTTRQEITSAPILTECLAWLDCRVIDRRDTGDRIYYWADVLSGGRTLAARDPDSTTLREQEVFAAATAEQKQMLRANLHADLEIQAALVEKWRAQLSDSITFEGREWHVG